MKRSREEVIEHLRKKRVDDTNYRAEAAAVERQDMMNLDRAYRTAMDIEQEERKGSYRGRAPRACYMTAAVDRETGKVVHLELGRTYYEYLPYKYRIPNHGHPSRYAAQYIGCKLTDIGDRNPSHAFNLNPAAEKEAREEAAEEAHDHAKAEERWYQRETGNDTETRKQRKQEKKQVDDTLHVLDFL